MDLSAVFHTRLNLIVPLCIFCLGNICLLANSSASHKQMGNINDVVPTNRAQMDEFPYEDYEEEETPKEEDPMMFVDACESEHAFTKMATGINPDSRLVQLHPATWVYTTRCRPHRAGKSCRGLDGTVSVCRPKRSWVQVYGRIAGDHGSWQPQWVAVDTSCSCLVKTPLSFLVNKSKYAE